MILVDTNVWSALNHPDRNRNVARWFGAHAEQCWLSTIVIAEIRFGIENPDAARRRAALERWLADLELGYRNRILPFDIASAHRFGLLVAERKMAKQETKLLDIQIAAQALSRGWAVATRNLRDFEWTGVDLIDPWTT